MDQHPDIPDDPARRHTPEQHAAYWGVDDVPRFLTKEEAEALLQGRVLPSQVKRGEEHVEEGEEG